MAKYPNVQFEKHYPDLHGILLSWFGPDYQVVQDSEFEEDEPIYTKEQLKMALNATPEWGEKWERTGNNLAQRVAYRYSENFGVISVQGAFSAKVFRS